ncbi:imidazole glycerol phosphate synthase subunit HisF [Legionella dresdenensis]|uniref:imidazole glycerol-phosphate synthase n=1 Tax=Legionella dresdenensis TaxID=450200 RepID=A0ABV8CBL3_9GAMM
MLKKRIIPCLDVKDGKVVKGVQFKQHQIVGNIIELAARYCEQGADELVFYDIAASCTDQLVAKTWVKDIARQINIPFCVAGGIKTVADAAQILESGADKISINSPALANPDLICQLADRFGSQAVVVGIDSYQVADEGYVYQFTGNEKKMCNTGRSTLAWAKEAIERGAGELVINCMNNDGVRQGYDIAKLAVMAATLTVPLIASGGAGCMADFKNLFTETRVSGALAASVFHQKLMKIAGLKQYLASYAIEVRL